MAIPLEGVSYVVCWTADRKRRFDSLDLSEWSSARLRFENQVALLASGTLGSRSYTELSERGGGIPPHRRIPVGIFRAHRLEISLAPDLFACVYLRPRVIPLLGPANAVETRLRVFRERGFKCVCYTPVTPAEANAVRKPPSEAKRSVSAQHVLDRIIADESEMRTLLGTLSVGELIWVGEEARRATRADIAREAADLAVTRIRTPGTLNLLGGALRDQHSYDRSIEVFTESIELQESAEWNPYGYIGLAASLRRKGRQDEAWDELKRPLRYYPDNEYAVRVRAALEGDLGITETG